MRFGRGRGWLPVDEGANSEFERQRRTEEADKHQPLLVILVVDDDSLVLTNTAAMLEDLGHTAIGVPSGTIALETLRQDDSIDLVISDQIMPRMTGTQLAMAIKAEWPELSVVLASGFAEIPSGSHWLSRLPKPFSQSELSKKITEVHPSIGKARVLEFTSTSSNE
jgi:CheY-like chemotaxis protein